MPQEAVLALQLLYDIWGFIAYLWPLWAFLVIISALKSGWLFWRNELYKKSSEYTMKIMEIQIPREVRKNPRGMEQALLAMHALRNVAGDLREKWWDGEVTRPYSFEMVSLGGRIRFFIRFFHKQRPLIESALLSYYQDLELTETEDYIEELPENMKEIYHMGYDLWGSEMVLKKEPAYPIRSYMEFEAMEDEAHHDPMSYFMEVLGKAKREEVVAIQFIIAPASPDWREEFEELVNKLRKSQEEQDKKKKFGTGVKYPGGPLPHFEVHKHEEEKVPFITLQRTPGETDVLEAVENNLSKPAFETLIRFVYLSPQPLFYDSYARRGIVGSFNQYGALHLNYFVQNYPVGTRTRLWQKPYIFPKIRCEYRKASLLHKFREREMPHEQWMGKLLFSNLLRWDFASRNVLLNAESMATLFHPPTFVVLTAPHIKRMESKKAGAPAGLPIYGDEKEIEKFQ